MSTVYMIFATGCQACEAFKQQGLAELQRSLAADRIPSRVIDLPSTRSALSGADAWLNPLIGWFPFFIRVPLNQPEAASVFNGVRGARGEWVSAGKLTRTPANIANWARTAVAGPGPGTFSIVAAQSPYYANTAASRGGR